MELPGCSEYVACHEILSTKLTKSQLLQGGLGVTGFDGVAHMIEGM